MKPTLDYPPVWLFAGIALAWVAARIGPAPLGGTPGALLDAASWALIGAGLGLMVLAALEFRRRRTTIIPHRTPDALVTGGVFRVSRNPIYLADVLILAGVVLGWQAWLALPAIPALAWVLQRRFIAPEEARLRAAFGAEADAWFARTRRWI